MSPLLDGLTLLRRHLFGTAAKAALPRDVVVRDTKALAKDWRAFQTWTGPASINNEMARFKAFNPTNHPMGTDALWLTGNVDRAKFKGGYEPVVARLARPSELNKGKTATVLWLDVWPSEPIDGAAFGYAGGGFVLARDNDYRVSGQVPAQKMVTISPPLTKDLATGTEVRFIPPITSGQIWSVDTIPLGKGQTFAVEATLIVPDDTAKGAWPAFWIYGDNDAVSKWLPGVGDEIDVYEGYRDKARGAVHYSGTNHQTTDITFHKADEGWEPFLGGAYRKAPFSLAGEHTFTCIIEPARVLKFVDGIHVRTDTFTWKNPRRAQIGVDLAIGSLHSVWDGWADLRPTSDDCFKGMRLGVKSISVYAA